jgi:hypothetical protein
MNAPSSYASRIAVEAVTAKNRDTGVRERQRELCDPPTLDPTLDEVKGESDVGAENSDRLIVIVAQADVKATAKTDCLKQTPRKPLVCSQAGFDLENAPEAACRGWFVGLVNHRTKKQLTITN